MSTAGWLVAGVVVLVVGNLVAVMRDASLRPAYGMLRGVRVRHVLWAAAALVVTVGVASLLLRVPGLGWSWWTWLVGLDGTPALGAAAAAQDPEVAAGLLGEGASARDASRASVWATGATAAALSLLVVAVPALVLAEEEVFRWGAESWSLGRRAVSAAGFGVAHAVVGVPLGAAAAIAVAGGVFTWVYVRAAREAPGGLVRDFTAAESASVQGVDAVVPGPSQVDAVPQNQVRQLACAEAARVHMVYNYLALLAVVVTLVAAR